MEEVRSPGIITAVFLHWRTELTERTMQRYYILEGLFILLGLGFLVTAIKYPKDIFIKLPLEIVKLPFRRFWWLISLPLTILAIPLIYFGEKYKWRITPILLKLLNLGESDKSGNRKW